MGGWYGYSIGDGSMKWTQSSGKGSNQSVANESRGWRRRPGMMWPGKKMEKMKECWKRLARNLVHHYRGLGGGTMAGQKTSTRTKFRRWWWQWDFKFLCVCVCLLNFMWWCFWKNFMQIIFKNHLLWCEQPKRLGRNNELEGHLHVLMGVQVFIFVVRLVDV